MGSNVSDETKKSLNEARKYAEGRGIPFDIHNSEYLEDIRKLIKIKVGH